MEVDEMTPDASQRRPNDVGARSIDRQNGPLHGLVSVVRRVSRMLLPRHALSEARRLRDLSPAARSHYLKNAFGRWRKRPELPRFDTGSTFTVVFVCHGNIMRSAIAAELFRAKTRRLRGRAIVVRSAGTNAVSGSVADPRMCQAATALGLSLALHRATPITESVAREADAVFVMDYLNEAELLARVPVARSKVHLLGAYDPSASGGVEIQDPFMSDAAAAHQCAQRIDACLDELVAALERGDAQPGEPARAGRF